MDKYKNIDDIHNNNIIDCSKIEDDSIKFQDGLDGLAEILGGIALVAAENKKLLQSRDPTVLEGALKSAGVLGASLVGIGGSIAKFAAKNSDIAFRK